MRTHHPHPQCSKHDGNGSEKCPKRGKALCVSRLDRVRDTSERVESGDRDTEANDRENDGNDEVSGADTFKRGSSICDDAES